MVSSLFHINLLGHSFSPSPIQHLVDILVLHPQRTYLSWLLAMVLFMSTTSATPLQFPMHTLKSMSHSQGDDKLSLLHQMAQSLNHGRQGGWERLMNPPITTGSHAIVSIHPLETRDVVQSWGVDAETLEKTYRDI